MSTNTEPIPGANPTDKDEFVKGTQRSEKGNIASWAQELTGEATLNTVERQGKRLRVIAAEHFSSRAAEFLQRDIAGQIEDPTKWVFLIEGKDSGVHETVVASELAKKKGIPVVDPIFHPYQSEVIQLYLDSEEGKAIPREIVVGQLAGDLANARGTTDLEEIATILDVGSSGELYAAMLLAAAEKSKDPNLYTARSEQMRKGLTRVSNLVSSQVLDYFLRQYPDRPEVAIYLGKAHEAILDVDNSEIPEGLRFSNEQIGKMVKDREMFRIKQILRANGIALPAEEKEKIPVFPTRIGRPLSIEPKAKVKGRLAQIIDEMPGLPPSLRDVIGKWSENIFGLDYVRSRGFQKYLDSNSSLDQIWGAAALLAERVEGAKKEGRNLSIQEIEEARQAFTKAAESRAKDAEQYRSQKDELMEIARGVDKIAKIIDLL